MNKSVILIFLFPLLLFTGCQKQLSFDQKCLLDAQEQTRKLCPRSIATGITLDSIGYSIHSHTLYYYYTMSQDFDNQKAINAGKGKFREALKNQIINSIDLKKFKDRGITFRYIYFSKTSKKKLLEEVYTKKDYAK